MRLLRFVRIFGRYLNGSIDTWTGTPEHMGYVMSKKLKLFSLMFLVACSTTVTGPDPSRVEGVWAVVEPFDFDPSESHHYGTYYHFRPDGSFFKGSSGSYFEYGTWRMEGGKLHITTPCWITWDWPREPWHGDAGGSANVISEVYKVSISRWGRMTLRFQEDREDLISRVYIAYNDSLELFELHVGNARSKRADLGWYPRLKGDRMVLRPDSSVQPPLVAPQLSTLDFPMNCRNRLMDQLNENF